MNLVQLIHEKQLNYPMARDLPPLEWEGVTLPEDSLIVSFRENPSHAPTMIRKNLHACQRLLDLPVTQNLVLIGLETDSPLAPLILWDLVHVLPVNSKIILLDNCDKPGYLQRNYFAGSLRVIAENGRQRILEKVAPLLVEKAAGLDRWSFGIPVGPEDATGLNAVVKRILELDIPEKEIILCGRPGANFKYWQQVRIVGEDIPVPPVRICAKKNALAVAARFENICILHDRVFLPLDFYKGVQRFGDFFPFVALQSIFFADKHNFLPYRYSDYGQSLGRYSTVQGFNRSGKLSSIFPDNMAELEKNSYIYANPLRYTEMNYATGSLFICKKELWLSMPQDENLFWSEFEDIEHCLRAAASGISARINPYLFTQSLFSRPLLVWRGDTSFEAQQGQRSTANIFYRAWINKRKPLLKVSLSTAHKKLQEFITRYVSPADQITIISTTAKLPSTAQTWVLQAGAALALAKVAREQQAVKAFLRDVEKMVIIDEVSHSFRQFLLLNFCEHGTNAKNHLFEYYWLWHAFLTVSPGAKIFYEDLQDFFVSRNSKTRIGSFVAACWLKFKNKNLFYHPDGFRGFYKAIINSTPYLEHMSNENFRGES